MANHFWAGSLCYSTPDTVQTGSPNNQKSTFPSNVIAASDTLTILEDLGNHIPDKSWMIYLLELFEKKTQVPIELDLICQFNNRDNFWAIFKGSNRHKFTKVLPAVGHSYQREIIMSEEKE